MTFGRHFSDRRIATKLALSFSVVLAITASVGVTGYHFLGVLEDRMANTADIVSVNTALQTMVTEAARYRATGDNLAAKSVAGSMAAQRAGLALRDEAEAAGAVVALETAERQLAAAVEHRRTRVETEARLVQSMQELDIRGLKVSDAVTKLAKDAGLGEARALDQAKAATRLLAGSAELRAVATAVADRFGAPANAEADAAVAGGLNLTRTLRKLGSAIPKTSPVDSAALGALATRMTETAGAATQPGGDRSAAVQAATALVAAIDGLTAEGIAQLSEAGAAQLDAAPAKIAADAAEAGAMKFVSSVRKLGVDFASFRSDPRKGTLDSLLAQVQQVAQIAEILSGDGRGAPEIESLQADLAPVFAAVTADARQLRDAEGWFIAYMADVRIRLGEAANAVSAMAGAENVAAREDVGVAQFGIVAALVAAVVVALGIGMALAMAIRSPIQVLTRAMERLAGGDTEIDLPGAERRDEIGEMSRAVMVFRDNAIARLALEESSRAESEAREARNRRIEALINGFQSQAAGLLDSVSQSGGTLRQTADALDGIADQTANRAGSALDASSRTSESVQTVAASAEELAASIEEISRQVERTKGIVDVAVDRAREADASMSGLNEMADRIGNVIQLIKAVADQTNLLALNATIEAARAGEAGKGFAVVAAEVKGLARQTADATEEISRQIAAIQDATTLSVDRIAAIARTMDEIGAHTAGIAAAVQEQGAATSEISANIAQVAGSTRTVAADMTELNTAVAQTTGMAGSVLTASTGMGRTADDLRSAIEGFLKNVAAA